MAKPGAKTGFWYGDGTGSLIVRKSRSGESWGPDFRGPEMGSVD